MYNFIAYIALFIIAVLSIMALLLLPLLFFANYILSGIAYYKLAKARNISAPGLAWVPIVNLYLIGKISDDIKSSYQKKSNNRILLLVFIILAAVLSGIFSNIMININIYLNSLGIFFFMFAAIFAFAMTAVIIYFLVLFFVAIYTIYKEYNPKNAVMYLVLSILLSFIGIKFIVPIFMLTFINNKIPASKQDQDPTNINSNQNNIS